MDWRLFSSDPSRPHGTRRRYMHDQKLYSVTHGTEDWAIYEPRERFEHEGEEKTSSDVKPRFDLCEFCRSINFTQFWNELSTMAPEGLGVRPDKSWKMRSIDICDLPRSWPTQGSYCELCRIGTYALNGDVPDHLTPLRLSMYTLPPDGGKVHVGLELCQEYAKERSLVPGPISLRLGNIYPEISTQTVWPYLDYDWLKQQLHIMGTKTRQRPSNSTKILLFDCNHLVPVQACTDSSYVALSYVIGPKPWQPQRDLHRVKLTMEQLPMTIRDAVHFTRALGEQFLWVDALCIPVIDGPERRRQLALMADIYSQARVTLVSLGDNHDSPIPGVTTAREYEYSADTDLGTLCLSSQVILDVIISSAHNTRGWVLQEVLLSRAVLYSLQCGMILAVSQTEVAAEYTNSRMIYGAKDDTNLNKIGCDKLYESSLFESYLTPFPADSKLQSENFDWDFSEYCSRSLTYEGDSFDAFRGYLNCLPYPSLWGIVCDIHRSDPGKKFDLQTSYTTAFLQGLFYQRAFAPPAADINLVSAGSGNGPLIMAPSWSWVSKRQFCSYPDIQRLDITFLNPKVSIVAPDGSESSCAAFFSSTADGRLKSEQVRLLKFHAPILELELGPTYSEWPSNTCSATVISETFDEATSGLDVEATCHMDTGSCVKPGSVEVPGGVSRTARAIALSSTATRCRDSRCGEIYGLVIQRQSGDRWKRTGLFQLFLASRSDKASWRGQLFDQAQYVFGNWPRETIILE